MTPHTGEIYGGLTTQLHLPTPGLYGPESFSDDYIAVPWNSFAVHWCCVYLRFRWVAFTDVPGGTSLLPITLRPAVITCSRCSPSLLPGDSVTIDFEYLVYRYLPVRCYSFGDCGDSILHLLTWLICWFSLPCCWWTSVVLLRYMRWWFVCCTLFTFVDVPVLHSLPFYALFQYRPFTLTFDGGDPHPFLITFLHSLPYMPPRCLRCMSHHNTIAFSNDYAVATSELLVMVMIPQTASAITILAITVFPWTIPVCCYSGPDCSVGDLLVPAIYRTIYSSLTGDYRPGPRCSCCCVLILLLNLYDHWRLMIIVITYWLPLFDLVMHCWWYIEGQLLVFPVVLADGDFRACRLLFVVPGYFHDDGLCIWCDLLYPLMLCGNYLISPKWLLPSFIVWGLTILLNFQCGYCWYTITQFSWWYSLHSTTDEDTFHFQYCDEGVRYGKFSGRWCIPSIHSTIHWWYDTHCTDLLPDYWYIVFLLFPVATVEAIRYCSDLFWVDTYCSGGGGRIPSEILTVNSHCTASLPSHGIRGIWFVVPSFIELFIACSAIEWESDDAI